VSDLLKSNDLHSVTVCLPHINEQALSISLQANCLQVVAKICLFHSCVQNRLSGERDIKKNKAIHHFLKPEKPVTAERQHANPRAFWTRKQKKKVHNSFCI